MSVIVNMKTRITILLTIFLTTTLTSLAQQRRVQNKPYIDQRPLHFGILVGTHLQDIEMDNVGLQTIMSEDGTPHERLIVTDADRWNTGFTVGVLADWRLHEHLSLRFSPALHFGSNHITFHDLKDTDAEGHPHPYTQDLKNTYLAVPVSLKFSAQRWNNYRPYLTAGISPMVNLTSPSSDYIRLKRFTTMIEVGLGCDFYLPYFKWIPELKFCYGLGNSLDRGHKDRLRDANKQAFAGSVSSAQTKMVVLTFYFE